jgi:DNA sulfur modification protein DndC
MKTSFNIVKPKLINFIDDIIEELRIAYNEDSRPWVVGFSGGKDSTALVQFIYSMLLDLPVEKIHKKVFIIASDTLVEMPSIEERIIKEITLMQKAADKNNLPIEVHRVYPEMNDRF